MNRAEVLTAIQDALHRHKFCTWTAEGEQAVWTCGMSAVGYEPHLAAAALDAALAAQEGERGGVEVAAAVEAVLAQHWDWKAGRSLHAAVRHALADPAGALATHDAEVEVREVWAIRFGEDSISGGMYGDAAEDTVRFAAGGREVITRTETISRTPWVTAPERADRIEAKS